MSQLWRAARSVPSATSAMTITVRTTQRRLSGTSDMVDEGVVQQHPDLATSAATGCWQFMLPVVAVLAFQGAVDKHGVRLSTASYGASKRRDGTHFLSTALSTVKRTIVVDCSGTAAWAP